MSILNVLYVTSSEDFIYYNLIIIFNKVNGLMLF